MEEIFRKPRKKFKKIFENFTVLQNRNLDSKLL